MNPCLNNLPNQDYLEHNKQKFIEIKQQYQDQGVKLTMMPFFVKALSLAITQFPVLNSQVNDECTELTYFNDHNIGMAVDSKIGLLVPNIKQCQAKSIVDIAQEISRLTDSAREGRVAPDDLKGGTISISNIGAIGGTTATPIINNLKWPLLHWGKYSIYPVLMTRVMWYLAQSCK